MLSHELKLLLLIDEFSPILPVLTTHELMPTLSPTGSDKKEEKKELDLCLQEVFLACDAIGKIREEEKLKTGGKEGFSSSEEVEIGEVLTKFIS